MSVTGLPGSERFETTPKRPDELVISPKLKLYCSDHEGPIDPITFEVISNKLVQLQEEVNSTIKKVSGSPMVTEANDFNVAMSDESGQLLSIGTYAQALGSPIQDEIQWTLEHRSENPGIEDGDMFLTNDPWVGAPHQPDTSVLCPIFVDGALFCWQGSKMHLIDVGGSEPGAMISNARNVFQESVPTPPVKLVRNFEIQADIEDMFIRRSRMPMMTTQDLRAMVVANNLARARILEIVEKYSAPVTHKVMKLLLDHAEARFRARLLRLPDGEWQHTHFYEIAGEGDRGVYRIVTKMRKVADTLTFDFTESDPQQEACFNGTQANTRCGVIAALLPLLCPDIPWAAGGIMRAIEFEFTPGTIPAAVFPSSVSGGIVQTAILGANAATLMISKMLSAGPEDLRRNLLAVTNGALTVFNMFGVQKDGNPAVFMSADIVAGGTGARTWEDGDAIGGSMISAGVIVANVETAEHYNPLLWLYRREVLDGGGPGRFNGGGGGTSAVIPHDTPAPVQAQCWSQYVAVPGSEGINGGMPGKTSMYQVLKGARIPERFAAGELPTTVEEIGGEAEYPPPKMHGVLVEADDVYVIAWGAGGGYGDPLERDPERVLFDVEQEIVSAEAAERTFGVVLVDGDVDVDATARLRSELRGKRIGKGPLDPPAPFALPEGARRLDENLVVTADGATACGHCQTVLAPHGGNYKEGAVLLEHDPLDIGRAWVPARTYIDSDVVVRQFFCPGCATLLEHENALPGSPLVLDKLLY